LEPFHIFYVVSKPQCIWYSTHLQITS
jgi:hypothetical protein